MVCYELVEFAKILRFVQTLSFISTNGSELGRLRFEEPEAPRSFFVEHLCSLPKCLRLVSKGIQTATSCEGPFFGCFFINGLV